MGVAVGEEGEFVDGEVVAGAEDADAAALVEELVGLEGPVGGVAPDVDALCADAEATEEEDAQVDGEVVEDDAVVGCFVAQGCGEGVEGVEGRGRAGAEAHDEAGRGQVEEGPAEACEEERDDAGFEVERGAIWEAARGGRRVDGEGEDAQCAAVAFAAQVDKERYQKKKRN